MTARTDNNGADQNRPPVSTSPAVTDADAVKEKKAAIAPSDSRPALKEKQQPLVDAEANTTAVPCDKKLDKPCCDAAEAVKSESAPNEFVETLSPGSDDSDKAAAMIEDMLKRQRRRIAEDLKKLSMSRSRTPFDLDKRLQAGIATEERIKEFLERSPAFNTDKRLWAGFVNSRELEEGVDLDDIVIKIIEAVMEDWGLNADGRRKLRRAHDLKFLHEEKDSPLPGYSSPTFVIEAKGPSFGLPSQGDLGFSNVTTCITMDTGEGQPGRDMLTDMELQTTYARQIFLQQPNRQSVRTCSIGEGGRVQWYHFDRNGIQTGFCGLNSYDGFPRKWIELIIGLCSLDEQVLGLDTSVQWQVDATGRKFNGTLTTVDDDESKISKTYQLLKIDPVSKKSSIYGTGTLIWAVRDPENGQEVLVKDSWREESWYPEFESLKAARNLDGLAQMISYEGTRAQTKDFCKSYYPQGSCRNQIQSRIVLEKYGPHLFCFQSERQLLCAIRDAIAGHRNLFLEAGIIQHDIAWRNILFGKPDATPGNRGVLIDFDRAEPVSLIKPESMAVGHSQFYSIAILKNALTDPWDQQECLLAHDYLDELESAFYTTASVMWELNEPGTRQDPCPEFVTEWLDTLDSLEENLRFKMDFILDEEPVDPTEFIGPYWSEASHRLLEKFYMFIRDVAQDKEDIRDCYGNELAKNKLEESLLSEPTIRENYDYVINLFDVAIMDLDRAQKYESDSTIQGIKRKVDEVNSDSSTAHEGGDERARRRKLD
ncbi:hypothetical protein EST38_g1302 [Candolleomyces aberdarensis]|uniref:Fungal-type protein kinase domain-containing protein n=1 Tax=Candolleomyces aberdarensis TaxID=2316362 RepID=A0A4Q2DXT8_9AGAR|nr:hypothetical protein EST38_g1302 [Candolleomyces aberdarensis]